MSENVSKSPFIKVGDHIINVNEVSFTSWDRGYGDSTFTVTMKNGKSLQFKHTPYYTGGIDCYDIEEKILNNGLLVE